MSNHFAIKQALGVQVIRKGGASGKPDKFNTPVKCFQCGNMRTWTVRCEYCGSSLEEKTNELTEKPEGPIPDRALRQVGPPPRKV